MSEELVKKPIDQFFDYIDEQGLPLVPSYKEGGIINKKALSKRFYKDILEWGETGLDGYAQLFILQETASTYGGSPRDFLLKRAELALYFAETQGWLTIQYNPDGQPIGVGETMLGSIKVEEYGAKNVVELIPIYLEGTKA
jgi:hypothetical protein